MEIFFFFILTKAAFICKKNQVKTTTLQNFNYNIEMITIFYFNVFIYFYFESHLF